MRQQRRRDAVRIGELARGGDYYQRIIGARNGAHASPAGRFAKIPFSLVNDLRLSGEAIRAFAVLRDVEYDGVCKISLRRLGQRVGRQEKATARIMRSLKETGWVEAVDETNGRCCIYRLKTPIATDGGLLTAPAIRDGGGSAETPALRDGGTNQTPAISNTGPPSSMAQTPVMDDLLPISSLNSLLESDCLQKNDDEERDQQLPRRLGDLYANILKNEAELKTETAECHPLSAREVARGQVRLRKSAPWINPLTSSGSRINA